jgi:hypothetical protein
MQDKFAMNQITCFGHKESRIKVMIERDFMKDDSAMQTVSFKPGAFIELGDPATGKRHLVLVADSGKDYIEYIEKRGHSTPLPILRIYQPKKWSDAQSVATELHKFGPQEIYTAYSDLLVALPRTPAGKDPLTLNRAAKWALDNKNFDTGDAAAAGVRATAEAMKRQRAILERTRSQLNLNPFDEDIRAKIGLLSSQPTRSSPNVTHAYSMPSLVRKRCMQ